MKQWTPYIGLGGKVLKSGYWRRIPDPEKTVAKAPAPGLQRLLGRAHLEEEQAPATDEPKQDTDTK
jgi:hypothetical protein